MKSEVTDPAKKKTPETSQDTPKPRRKRVRKRRPRERAKRRTGSLKPKETLSRQAMACLALLGACLVISPQLFAGTFGWSVVVIAALAVAALATTWNAWQDRNAHVCDIVIFGAWTFTILQALPLPHSLAEFLAPMAVENSRQVLQLLGDTSSSWSFWSYDPGSTAIEALKGSAIVSAYLAARSGLLSHLLLAKLCVASVAVLAFVTLVHLAGVFDGIFGIYTPTFTPQLPSPVLTSNHAGGFFALGTVVAVGLALSAKERKRLPLWICLSGIFAVLCVASLSRGAVAALLLGVGVLLVHSRVRGKKSRWALVAATLGFGTLVAFLYVGSYTFVKGLSDDSAEKVQAAWQALPIAWEHPWLGIGRGSFASVYASLDGGDARYLFPENILVQWMTEWGVPMTVLLVWFLSLTLMRVLMTKGTSTIHIALTSGVIAIALQNLVDFSFEMVGLAVVYAALLGGLIDPQTESVARVKLRHLAGVTLLLSLVVAVGTTRQTWHGTSEERANALIDIFRTDGQAQQGFDKTQASLLTSLRRHPAEPTFSLVAGARAAARQDPKDALQWLSRAMLLAPKWASPHVTTAEVLLSTGRVSQAALEVREAERRRPGSTRKVTCRILGLSNLNPDARMALVSKMAPKANRISFFDMSAGCKRVPQEFKTALDTKIINEGGTLRAPLIRSAARALNAKDPQKALSILSSLDATDWDVVRWTARATADLKTPIDGVELIERQRKKRRAPDSVLVTLARLQAEARQEDAMRETLSRLRGRSGGKKVALAKAKKLEGDLLMTLGDSNGAMEAYEESVQFNPKSTSLEAIFHLAESKKLHQKASRIQKTLCSLRGGFWCRSK